MSFLEIIEEYAHLYVVHLEFQFEMLDVIVIRQYDTPNSLNLCNLWYRKCEDLL